MNLIKGIRKRPALRLVILLVLSTWLTATANRLSGRLLLTAAPGAAWLADAAVPSMFCILLLFLRFGRLSQLAWPILRGSAWQRIGVLSARWLLAWLLLSALAALLTGGWITYATAPAERLAFLIFGPIGEEMLFRGLILEAAVACFPDREARAVLVSAVAFSLHHIQLHDHPFEGLALAQLAFTLPMGIVLARVRLLSGSLWPPLLLHIATNLPAAW